MKPLKILDFCNLLDDSGRLSITNIAAIVLVAKLALTHNPDLATVGSTAIGLLNYAHKRFINAKQVVNDDLQGSGQVSPGSINTQA